MMRFIGINNICSVLLLVSLSSSSQAGIFDDLSRGIQNEIKKTVKDAVTGPANESDEDDEDDEFADTETAADPYESVGVASESNVGSKSVTALMSSQVFISRIGGYFKGGQFGARSNDYGLMIEPRKPEFPTGMRRCSSFVYDQFSQLRNDANLKSLQNQYSSKRGQKIVLENVRIAQGSGVCVYSNLRFVSSPANPGKFSANVQNNEVTGIVRGLGYGVQRVNIPKKNKPNRRNIPVLHMMLSQTRTSGFDAKQCKVYYSALEEDRMVATPQAIKQLRPNVSRVTLKDVYMLDQLKGHCVFDHYKSFKIPRVNQVAAKAEANAQQDGRYSFKYHVPQITAVIQGHGRDAITASFNKLKQYGYGVTNGRSHISARGQVSQNQLLVRYNNKNRPVDITSNTLIQKSKSGCDAKANVYVNDLIKRFALKPTKRNSKGQVQRFIKGSLTGTVGYNRHECAVSFTANIGSATQAKSASATAAKAATKYKGMKYDVIQLCADIDQTRSAIRAAGYQGTIGHGPIRKAGLYSNLKKQDGQYRYVLQSLRWQKGKVTAFTFRVYGEDAYAKLYAKQRTRFEATTGHKMQCKKSGSSEQCLYRNRPTQTRFALNAAKHDRNFIGINAGSACR